MTNRQSAALALFLGIPLLAAPPSFAAGSRRWLTRDFAIEPAPAGARVQSISLSPQDCRARIARIICVAPGGDPLDDRCVASGAPYAPLFQELYDEYPPLLKNVFCSVNHIYVYQKLDSVAATFIQGDVGRVTGVEIGVRQSLADSSLSLSDLVSWKEQIPFGGDSSPYRSRSDLPQAEDRIPGAVHDDLYYVFAHEFGHVLDAIRDLTDAGGFKRISWIDWDRTRYDSVFPNRLKVHFYDAPPALTRADVPQTYAQLQKTDFVSLYAATDPYEDLAETVAAYAVAARSGSLVIHTRANPDVAIDAVARLNSPLFARKRRFVEDLFHSVRGPRASAALARARLSLKGIAPAAFGPPRAP